MNLLKNLPFGTLVIEGVPGSGKTTVARWILTAILASTYSPDDIKATHENRRAPGSDIDFAEDELEEFDEPDKDTLVHADDTDFKFPEEVQKEADTEQNEKMMMEAFDIPTLTFGPTKEQYADILAEIQTQAPKAPIQVLLDSIRRVYSDNLSALRIQLEQDGMSESRLAAFDFKWGKHWRDWEHLFHVAIERDETLYIEHDTPDAAQKQSPELGTIVSTTALRECVGLNEAGNAQPEAEKEPVPPPKVMIIANQNINGEDLARELDLLYRDIGHPIAIVKVNNIEHEREALIRRYRFHKDETDKITMIDMMDAGVDDQTLKDLASGSRVFGDRKKGGVFRLDAILCSMLENGEELTLLRELEALRSPIAVFNDERMRRL